MLLRRCCECRLRWQQPLDAREGNNGSRGAQLPLKQLPLFLSCFLFLCFFLRCHVDLLTSGLIACNCIMHLLLQYQTSFPSRLLFCFRNAITLLGAPILCYVRKKMQHFCKKICRVVVAMLRVCRRNLCASVKVITNSNMQSM